MAKPTKHEQFEKMMKMPVEEHGRRADAFTTKAEAAAAQAEQRELEQEERLDAAEIFAGENKHRQANLARRQARAHGAHADVLRKQEALFQTHAQNHTLAMGRIAAEKARIHTAAVRHANAYRRANPNDTTAHQHELVDFHTSRLSEAAGLAPYSVQHQGETIRITHNPIAGFIPAHSWLAKTIRRTRTGHPHGTKAGGRRTRRRRRSKRRRTRRRHTKRQRTRRRHKTRRRRQRRRRRRRR